jgi:hypothetical protein
MNSAEILKVLRVEHEPGTCIVSVQALMRFGDMPLCGTVVLAFASPELASATGLAIIDQVHAGAKEPYRYEESYIAPNGEKVVLATGRVFPVGKKEDLLQ